MPAPRLRMGVPRVVARADKGRQAVARGYPDDPQPRDAPVPVGEWVDAHPLAVQVGREQQHRAQLDWCRRRIPDGYRTVGSRDGVACAGLQDLKLSGNLRCRDAA